MKRNWRNGGWNERKATVMGDRLLNDERIRVVALKENKGMCPGTITAVFRIKPFNVVAEREKRRSVHALNDTFLRRLFRQKALPSSIKPACGVLRKEVHRS